MAGGLVQTETNLLLKSSLNGAAYPLTTGSYVALTTSAASSTSAGTEVSTSGSSYVRQPAAFTVTNNTASNASAINFAGMPAATVVGINIFDAASAGNRRWWADLSSSRTTAAGDTISFAAGNVSFTVS